MSLLQLQIITALIYIVKCSLTSGQVIAEGELRRRFLDHVGCNATLIDATWSALCFARRENWS